MKDLQHASSCVLYAYKMFKWFNKGVAISGQYGPEKLFHDTTRAWSTSAFVN